MPKVTLQDVVPQRAVLRMPQLAEQLVDMPVPESVILAHGRCDLGVKWCQIATQGGRCYGHGRLWPNRLWPAFFATEFGQTDFGQNRLWPNRV